MTQLTFIGHKNTATLLETMLLEEKLPHAILLSGAKGLGKRRFADVLMRRILCGPKEADTSSLFGDDAPMLPLAYNENHPILPQIEAGSSPDVHYIMPESGKKMIRVEDVRAVLQKLSLAAEGKRVIIVDVADQMNNASANALLKTLEEPGEGVCLILLSHNISKLLPTIVSRCRHFKLSPLSSEDVLSVISEHVQDMNAESLKTAVDLCGGCPGEALRLLKDGQTLLPLIDDLLLAKPLTHQAEIVKFAETLLKSKDVPLVFDIILSRLYLTARALKSQEMASLYAEIQNKLNEMLTYNMNPQLTLEVVLKRISEVRLNMPQKG